MGKLPSQADMLDMILELRREVKRLQHATPLASASISEGGLKVMNGGGIDIEDGGRFNAKHPDADGGDDAFSAGVIRSEADGSTTGYGVVVQQADGTDIFSARTDIATGGTQVTVRDRSGEALIFTNPTNGGLAAPVLAYAMYPYSSAAWPSTTSGSFTGMLEGYARKAASNIAIGVTTVADAGTTGEARVLLNGSPVGPTISVGSSISTEHLVLAAPGAMHSAVDVIIEARRTAGAGVVRATSYYLEISS